MDKAAIKMMLSSYRADQDAHDPVFAEALGEARRDPELAAWFEEERRFDALMVGALKQVPIPAGLKETILLQTGSAGRPPVVLPDARAPGTRKGAAWLAMAAGLLLAFVLGWVMPRGPAATRVAQQSSDGANRFALQAISYTGEMPALQFVCFDSAMVAKWIDQKSAALDMGKIIDKPMARMQMIGSSTAQWDGKPVIMVALQNGDRMAMLYLVRAADFPGAAATAGEITERDGWVSKTGRAGKHLYALTTKGTRKDLNFPMPL